MLRSSHLNIKQRERERERERERQCPLTYVSIIHNTLSWHCTIALAAYSKALACLMNLKSVISNAYYVSVISPIIGID